MKPIWLRVNCSTREYNRERTIFKSGPLNIGNETFTCRRRKTNHYDQLQETIVFEALRAAIAEVVGAWDRSKRQAAERRVSRSWTSGEDEILQKGHSERRFVGDLARQLGRTPVSVRNRLNALGLLPIAEVQLGPTHYTFRENELSRADATRSSPANDQPKDPEREAIRHDFRSVSAQEEEEDDLHFQALIREQEELQRAEAEVFETMAAEYYDHLDRSTEVAGEAPAPWLTAPRGETRTLPKAAR